jgi:hypothetical protein
VKATNAPLGGFCFEVAPAKPKRQPRQKVKTDPKLVTAACELRDRYLEQVNADPHVLAASAKYHVGRALLQARAKMVKRATPLLTEAA